MTTLNFNLNRSLFEKKDYDSKFVSVLQSLHHRFVNEGHYTCNIYNRNRLLKTINISVGKENKALTNNLDINEILRNRYDHYNLSTNNYFGFYVSDGFMQYSISIYSSKSKQEIEFDSSNLRMNDIFCVSFIKPGKYIVENRLVSARMLVEVFPFDKRSVRPKKIEVKDKFESERIELMQTETLFFIVNNEKNNQIVVRYTDEQSDTKDSK
ncbi:hypothetical protein [Candidatus Nitrosocosmicus sp. SS]|uniref:hypothetical protein n=1 Tax=Candidatus Nitrosocosmicus agrestis TaxID=2563600 RepID=UPI00122E0A80|nr:hypothetical protein [Candidatus Nitrosocosmicus sp. SS]KAA2283730.1 hypothetical protein F1Z66_00105 [Candidatus Nitrosocosmicus sp. SS]KAF0870107.1 hypothetical protein E5N71_00830 [Candidatus Nitrosocosmicus sp. SS]